MIGGAPATPPGMRVRTGRFERLRSGQSGRSQLVEVRNGEPRFQEPVTVAPPAAVVDRHLFGHIFICPQRFELLVDRSGPLPVLELDGP